MDTAYHHREKNNNLTRNNNHGNGGWSSGGGGGGGNDNYYDNNNRCTWENLLYWLIKLIGAGISDLRRVDLRDVCIDSICHRY